MIILHRRGTTGEWYKADLLATQLPEVLLKDGEFAIEELIDGSRHVKIGDGHTKFCDLPYIDARAESVFFKELSITKATFDTKLSELAESHKKLITSTGQQLTQQIDRNTADLLAAVEFGDESTLATTKQVIADEVNAISADIIKNASAISEAKKSTEKQISSAKAQLANELSVVSNKLNSEIAATATNAAAALEREVARLDDLFRALLADTLTQHDNKNNATFDEISAKIIALNEIVNQLKTADASLNNTIIGVQNTSRAAVNKLTTELATLAEKHEADTAATNSELAKQADIRQTADTEILAFIQKHLIKIYAELADLVDDDILILEKTFSVENSLSFKIRVIAKELEELKAKFYELTPEGLAEIEARINQKLADVWASAQESLREKTEALDNRINNVKETFDTIISDAVVALKQTDCQIRDELEIVNKNAIKEIAAVKADASDRIDSIEAAFDSELTAIRAAYLAGDEKLYSVLAETEQQLSDKLAITEADLIHTVDNNKVMLLDELNKLKEALVSAKSALEATITNNDSKQSAALADTEARLAASDDRLANKITAVESSLVADITDLAVKTAVDIENITNSMRKVNSNYIRFNESDARLYIGETADSVILSGGTATDL